AAVYAYCYLFDEQPLEPPNPFDRRYRWACDLYNLGLEFALGVSQSSTVDLVDLPHELPVGKIDVVLDRSRFPWSEQQFPRFVPANDFDVYCMSMRYRQAGLGVPLIALRVTDAVTSTPADKLVAPRASVPATAFLRFTGGLAALEHGVQATLELHSGYDVPETRVGVAKVPLESDLPTPIAYSLQNNQAIWDFTLSGFFGSKDALEAN